MDQVNPREPSETLERFYRSKGVPFEDSSKGVLRAKRRAILGVVAGNSETPLAELELRYLRDQGCSL